MLGKQRLVSKRPRVNLGAFAFYVMMNNGAVISTLMWKAVLIDVRDYVRLAAPEPEVLRILEEESKRRGTDRIGSRQIDLIIQRTRQATRQLARSEFKVRRGAS